MPLPPSLWKKLPSALSSTLASSDVEAVAAEADHQVALYAKRVQVLTELRKVRTETVEALVRDQLTGLPLQQPTESLVRVVQRRLSLHKRSASEKVIRRVIRAEKKGVLIL